MSSSVRTDGQYHDHLRRLLDQRTARANLHGRFPSGSLSDFSDSPSIYSHAPFSPRPIDRVDDGVYASSSHHPSEPSSPMSDRQRLNIPNASSLDLDDDTHSLSAGTPLPDDDDESSSTEEGDQEEDGELHRVSAYGPKMTVHSRAPWEAGEDDGEDVADSDSTTRRAGFKFSKTDRSKKTKGSSGRHGPDPRPSTDSLRSQSKSKQSFDTVSSNVSAGGALLALAQASMSSTSLALSQAPSPQTSLRDKLALPRFRSRTPSNTNSKMEQDQRSGRPSVSSPSPYSSPSPQFRALSPAGVELYRGEVQSTYIESSSPHTPLNQQEFHPYANPDLVRIYSRDPSPAQRLEELHALAHSAPHSPAVIPSSESTVTLTDSSTTTTISTASKRSDTNASITPGTSLSSLSTQNEFSPTARTFGKGISGPIVLDGTSMMSVQTRTSNDSGGQASISSSRREAAFMPSGLAGWQENTGSAPIKLISLEEAQAQARERSRSATVNGTPIVADPLPPRPPQSSTRARMRTTSAGAKAKKLTSASAVDLHVSSESFVDPPSTLPHTAPPLKTVGKKKSGFMRLFNGKEKAQSPPPVPTISMEAMSSPPPIPLRTRKQSTHRVPVPSLTPSLLADTDGKGSLESRSDSDDAPSPPPPLPILPQGMNTRQLSLRRNAPELSIVTHPPPGTNIQVECGLTPTTGVPDLSLSSSSSTAGSELRSPDFVALSLRPVSMTFSAELAGRINSVVGEMSRPSLEADSGTPTTSTTAMSPLSPGFPLIVEPIAANDKHAVTGAAVSKEEQASVIQALQDQILAARRAWQRDVWELEGQVRDLKAEVDDLRAANSAKEYCPACGRGSIGMPRDDDAHIEDLRRADVKIGSVVNRPRARTGVGSRFTNRN